MLSRRKSMQEQGQTMVEFALIVPLLCVILLGIIQFGIVFKNYVTLTDSTRVGARKAAVSRHFPSPEVQVEAAVRNSAAGIDEPCAGGTGLCVTVDADAWEHGADVSVTARYPYEIDLLGVVVASGHLESTTTERVE